MPSSDCVLFSIALCSSRWDKILQPQMLIYFFSITVFFFLFAGKKDKILSAGGESFNRVVGRTIYPFMVPWSQM
jgi:hypothetical protein